MLIVTLFGVAYMATKALEKGAEAYRNHKEAAACGYRPVIVAAPAWWAAAEMKHHVVLTPGEVRQVEALLQLDSPERRAIAKELWS